jgi:hypothetical protein
VCVRARVCVCVCVCFNDCVHRIVYNDAFHKVNMATGILVDRNCHLKDNECLNQLILVGGRSRILFRTGIKRRNVSTSGETKLLLSF